MVERFDNGDLEETLYGFVNSKSKEVKSLVLEGPEEINIDPTTFFAVFPAPEDDPLYETYIVVVGGECIDNDRFRIKNLLMPESLTSFGSDSEEEISEEVLNKAREKNQPIAILVVGNIENTIEPAMELYYNECINPKMIFSLIKNKCIRDVSNKN